jgi:hypothetical protein
MAMGVATVSGKEGLRVFSQWARRRYSIEGDYIKPVPGSKVTFYNPFDHYYGAGNVKTGTSLYLELVALDTNDCCQIEQFASKWGLLGLFYHPLLQIRHRVLAYDVSAQRDDPSLPSWAYGFLDTVNVNPGLAFKDELPEATRAMEAATLEGSAVVHRPGLEQYVEECLTTYSQSYFPDLTNRAASLAHRSGGRTFEQLLYGALYSPARWDYLCEPVQRFQDEVKLLQENYHLCKVASEAGVSSYSFDLEERFAVHLRHVHPIAICSPGKDEVPCARSMNRRLTKGWIVGPLNCGWSFPSLLATAYLMLLLDTTENTGLRYCENETCRHPFVSRRSDRKYCSKGCKNAQTQRVFRSSSKKHREERKS